LIISLTFYTFKLESLAVGLTNIFSATWFIRLQTTIHPHKSLFSFCWWNCISITDRPWLWCRILFTL